MSDLAIKRAQPSAAALVEAVAEEDREAVADILTSMDTEALYALAIVLAGQLLPEADDAAKMRQAVAHAAHAFGITSADALSTSRAREAIDARATAAYVGRLLGISFVRIGRQIGRDHSTVMHSCGRVGETPRLRNLAHRIAEQLGWDREGVA